MSMFRGKEPQLVIGAAPRIDLMPPEVRQRQKDRSARFGMILIVIVAVGVVVVGYGVSLVAVGISQAQLTAEQARTQELLVEQQQYAEVPQINAVLEAGAEGQAVATSSQLDWTATMQAIRATMPAGLTLTEAYATSTSPIAAGPDPVGIGEAPYTAALSLKAVSASLPDTAAWLSRLQTVTGYAGAWLNSVSSADTGFTVDIVLHLGDKALVPPIGTDNTAGEGE